MATIQPQTKLVETLVTKNTTAEKLVKAIGRQLGSPINGKNVGETFTATLTGKIEIRDFNGQKGAYFTTKEGFSIRVNASFNPDLHKEGAVMNCICRELKKDPDAGILRDVKYTSFVD